MAPALSSPPMVPFTAAPFTVLAFAVKFTAMPKYGSSRPTICFWTASLILSACLLTVRTIPRRVTSDLNGERRTTSPYSRRKVCACAWALRNDRLAATFVAMR